MKERIPLTLEDEYRREIKRTLGDRFDVGMQVRVRRSSDNIESDWTLSHISETGKVVCRQFLPDGRFRSKGISIEDFLSVNPPESGAGEGLPKEAPSETAGTEAAAESPMGENWGISEQAVAAKGNPLEGWDTDAIRGAGIEGVPIKEGDEEGDEEGDMSSEFDEEAAFAALQKKLSEIPGPEKVGVEGGTGAVNPEPEREPEESLSEFMTRILDKENTKGAEEPRGEKPPVKDEPENKERENKIGEEEKERAARKWRVGMEALGDNASQLYRATMFALKETFPSISKRKEKIEEIRAEAGKIEEEEGPGGLAGVFLGLNGIGFAIQEMKGAFFSNLFAKLAEEKKKKGKTNELVLKILESYADIYRQVEEKGAADEEALHKGMDALKSLAGFWALLRTGALFYRIALGPTNPIRLVTAAAMTIGRGGEALKEAELRRESVMAGNRVEDVDEAFDQAMALYEKAGGRLSKDGVFMPAEGREVRKEDLEEIYRENIPIDILRRLKSPEKIAQKIASYHVKASLEKVAKKIADVEFGGLNAEEKKLEKQKIVGKYAKFILEMDKMVDRGGKVDMIAFYGGLLEKAGKWTSTAIAIETLAEGVLHAELASSDLSSGESGAGTAEHFVPKTGDSAGADVSEHAEYAEKTKGMGLSKIFERAEHPEIGKPEFLEETAGASFGGHEVARGEKLWHILEKSLEEKRRFQGLNDSQRAYAVDSMLNKLRGMPYEKIQEIGVRSGNPDLLYAGDHLDMDKIIGNLEADDAIDKARGLSAAALRSIEEAAGRGATEHLPIGHGTMENIRTHEFVGHEELPTRHDTFENLRGGKNGEAAEPPIGRETTEHLKRGGFLDGFTPESHDADVLHGPEHEGSPLPLEKDGNFDEIKPTPIETLAEARIHDLADKAAASDINEIYSKKGFLGLFGGESGVASGEWRAVRERSASEFLNFYKKLFLESGGRPRLSETGEKNLELFKRIQKLAENNKLTPESGETVESFFRRAASADVSRVQNSIVEMKK